MNKMPLWARVFGKVMTLGLLTFLGLFAAMPANAQNVPISTYVPGVIPDDAFVPWREMHKDSYPADNSSAVRQCYESIGIIEGLLGVHCEILAEKLERGECKVTWVADGEKYRWMRGRVNGNPNHASRLTPNLIKQLGRYDRALRCDLGNNIVVDWFTGVKNQSCNNLGFIYLPPPPMPTAKWVCRRVPFDSTIHSGVSQSLNSVLLENCCCDDLYVPNSSFILNDTLQSSGYAEVCDWE